MNEDKEKSGAKQTLFLVLKWLGLVVIGLFVVAGILLGTCYFMLKGLR
jgi:hypothetical protein